MASLPAAARTPGLPTVSEVEPVSCLLIRRAYIHVALYLSVKQNVSDVLLESV